MSLPTLDSLPLSSAPPDSILTVYQIDADGDDAVRLKRLGICQNRRLLLVQAGDPLIVRVVGCRVGISRRLASTILVRPCGGCPEPTDQSTDAESADAHVSAEPDQA